MKLGIIGKPQCGKTTIFNAASGHQESVGDFSQAVHRAVIKVPDQRLECLAEIVNPKKITYAEIEFLDAAGFTGEKNNAKGIEITPELRLMDAFMIVVDSFSSEATPETDLRGILDEMILLDQAMIESNIDKRERSIKKTGDKSGVREMELLRLCLAHLEEEKLLIDLEMSDDDLKILRGYQFLTLKPLLVVLNISEEALPKSSELMASLSEYVVEGRRDVASMCGKIEMELSALESDERMEFLSELGIKIAAIDLVIQKSYSLLGLVSYLTAGEPEVRAWTIKSGTNAQKAAGVIHSDIERGFIRAEVVAYDDYIEHKTSAALKAAGKSRLEGKNYLVQDGDVILFRFNV